MSVDQLVGEAWFPYAFVLFLAVPFVVLLRNLILQISKIGNNSGSGSSVSADITAPRLAAYERMTVFLERHRPQNLVGNFDINLTPTEFVYLSQKSIEQEWEYNAAQQLYISSSSWEAVAAYRQLLLKTLHQTLEEVPDVSLAEFKKSFLTRSVNYGVEPLEALRQLKKDIIHLP